MKHPNIRVIDVLGAVVIVALLAALLAPTLVVARKSSKKRDCQNNLKQIGVQVWLYEDRFCSFPPGTGEDCLNTVRTGCPDISQDNLFVCKVWGESMPGRGVNDYRGPAQPMNNSTPCTRPIAGDKTPNHGVNEDVNVLYFDGHVEVAPYTSAMWNDADKWLIGGSQVRPYDFWKDDGKSLCVTVLCLAGIAFGVIMMIRMARRYAAFDGEVERLKGSLERIGVAVRAFKESKGRYPYWTGGDFLDIISGNAPAEADEGVIPGTGDLHMDTAGLYGPISPLDDGVPADRPVAGATVSAFGRGAVTLVLYCDGSVRTVASGTQAWDEAGEWLDGLRVDKARRLVTMIILLVLVVLMAILFLAALYPAKI